MFMFINPGKTSTPWVLARDQESCLPYIKKGDKEDIENSRPISFIIKCNNISASKY